MKTNKALPLLFLPLFLCSFRQLPESQKAAQKSFDGRAYDKSLTMDFSDSTKQEIEDYYHYDTMIQKKGEDLKTYLHDIISTDNYFVNYGSGTTDGGVGTWYRITDRNWDISDPIDPSTYTFDTESSDSYYLVNFYFEASANYDKTKATNNNVNSTKLKETEGATKVDYENGTKPKGVSTDKEHIWAKNHGFKKVENKKDVFAKGAPTDLHHLVAADGNTNSAGHNDDFYGEVADKSQAKAIYCYYADGTSAISGWRGTDKQGRTVFEPTDEWKGDIARSLLYMGTRYGVKLEGGNTQAEPYLTFDDEGSYKDEDSNGKYDRSAFEGYHPNLSTYLKWNKEDPVSTYEFHRNNLIYKNVQKNRNPFVDYPSLADWVYGTTDESAPALVSPTSDNPYTTPDFSKLSKNYQLHVEEETTFDISFNGTTDLTVNYDTALLAVSEDKKTVKAKAPGTTTLEYTYKDKEGVEHKESTTIEIRDKIILLSVKPDTGVPDHMDLVTGETFSFDLGFKSMDAFFPEEKVIYSTDDSQVIQVDDNGTVKALNAGECNLYLLIKNKTSEKTLLKLKVKVTLSEEEMKKRKLYLLIIVIAAILLVLIFIIFAVLIKKSGKKNDIKSYTKVYNKSGQKKKSKSSKTTAKKKGKK